MNNSAQTILEKTLVKKKLISLSALSKAKLEFVPGEQSFEDFLVLRNLVSPADLLSAKSEAFGIPLVDVSTLIIPKDLLKPLPEVASHRHRALPFKEEGGKICVAMVDPQDLTAIEFLEKTYGMPLEIYLSSPDSFDAVISEQYSRSLGLEPEVSSALAEAEEEVTKIEESLDDIASARQVFEAAPLARAVSIILEYAVKAKASDVHIEPDEERTRVRYRVDGILSEHLTVSKSVHNALVSRIKILAHLKLDERRKPQDGRFKIEFGGRKTDLRISILPTIFGEKVVIRLLKDQATVLDFAYLGFTGINLKRMEEAIKHVNGIILVTGPTGSGKTVTLAACLTRLNTVKVNIVTLEDPVEVRVSGVNQVQINPQVGLTFASGLRSILRQDPNIVMVGEIRDAETAELAVHAALTGHLVLSTLHTNSASGALPRLLDMHIEPYLLVSTVNHIFAQRLVRKICSNCVGEEEAPPEVIEDVERVLGPLLPAAALSDGKLLLKKGSGCDSCGKSGYTGRIGIYESLAMSPAISKLILDRAPEVDISAQAVKEGMITLIQDGYLKALQGATTIEEVLRVARE